MADQTFAEAISKVLYPSDDHMQGKMLRLKQVLFSGICNDAVDDQET